MKALRSHAAAVPRLLIFAALAAVSACAPRQAPSLIRMPGGGEEVQLTIENQNYRDAIVYAVWNDGGRDRLGLVPNRSTHTFTIPWKGSDMQIETSFVAGDDVFTDPITVTRGDHVQLTLPPNAG